MLFYRSTQYAHTEFWHFFFKVYNSMNKQAQIFCCLPFFSAYRMTISHVYVSINLISWSIIIIFIKWFGIKRNACHQFSENIINFCLKIKHSINIGNTENKINGEEHEEYISSRKEIGRHNKFEFAQELG